MRVTLTFDLPDEKNELLLALHADQICCAILDLDQELRAHLKYGTKLDIGALRSELHESLSETGWQR